jgi:hypothetical protein
VNVLGAALCWVGLTDLLLVQVCGVNEIRRTPANEQDWEVEESMDTVLVADESDGEEVEGTLNQQAS